MSEEDWRDTVTTALRNMATPSAPRGNRARWLDRVPIVGTLRARGRTRRAMALAAQFEDPEMRGAATRVLAFVEKVRGTPVGPDELDAEVRLVLRPIIQSEGTFWHALELAAERGHVGRDHVVANLRNGTVRHLILHLATCRTCRTVRELVT